MQYINYFLTKYINANTAPNYVIQSIAELNTADNRQRAISIALPFLSLHSKTASAASHIARTYQLSSIWMGEASSKPIYDKSIDTFKLAGSVAISIIFPSGQLLYSSLVLFIEQAQKFQKGGNRDKAESLHQIISQIVHLASIYYGTPKWVVLSLLSQAVGEVRKACTEEKTPEAFAYALLAAIRGYKAGSCLYTELSLARVQQHRRSDSQITFLNCAGKTIPTELESDEPLEIGEFFHGYGKTIVKGMNLRYKTITVDGKQATELTFRINHVYQERLQQIVNAIRPDFEGIVNANAEFQIGQHRIESILGGKSPTATEFKFDGVGGVDTIMFGAFGTNNYLGLRDHVRVTLKHNSERSFQQMLSTFGLQDVLKPSTSEDLERMKMGILYRTFYPKEAYVTERSPAFFELPLDQLKQKMIDDTPPMKEIFNQQTPQPTELFQGYFRYGIPIDQRAFELGARALTCSVTGIRGGDYDPDEPLPEVTRFLDSDLDQLTSILKHGLLSPEFKTVAGLPKQNNGAKTCLHSYYDSGGAHSIYTQMITQEHLDKKLPASSLDYDAPVRFYISLRALNRGSYQDLSSGGGSRFNDAYANRLNILEFVQQNLTEHEGHEVMIPDRIHHDIKAMSFRTEELKQQAIAHFRKYNLIQNEKINGVPVNEFFQTSDYITPALVKHCGPKEPEKAG